MLNLTIEWQKKVIVVLEYIMMEKNFVHSERDSIQEAVSLIVKLRRMWILNKLIKFKITRENKQLRKL